VRKEGTKLTGAPAFDEEDPEAMKQYSKVEQGILKGASIGITPVNFDEANGIMITCSLKECSLTPVPANRKAIAIYNAKGQKLNAAEAKQYLLSSKPTTDKPKNEVMNKNLLAALLVLSAQAGLTINLSADVTDDEVKDTLKKVGDKIASLNSANVELSGKVTTMETEKRNAREKEITDLVTEGVNLKLFTADTAPSMIEFGKINLSGLKTMIAGLKPVTIETVVTPSKDKTTDVDGDNDKATWTYDDFALKAPQELEAMQLKDAKKFDKLLSAKIKKAQETHSINL
jgi:hypothetical protein